MITGSREKSGNRKKSKHFEFFSFIFSLFSLSLFSLSAVYTAALILCPGLSADPLASAGRSPPPALSLGDLDDEPPKPSPSAEVPLLPLLPEGLAALETPPPARAAAAAATAAAAVVAAEEEAPAAAEAEEAAGVEAATAAELATPYPTITATASSIPRACLAVMTSPKIAHPPTSTVIVLECPKTW